MRATRYAKVNSFNEKPRLGLAGAVLIGRGQKLPIAGDSSHCGCNCLAPLEFQRGILVGY